LIGEAIAQFNKDLKEAAKEALPTTVGVIAGVAAGVIADPLSPGRAAIAAAGAAVGFIAENAVVILKISQLVTEQTKSSLERLQELQQLDTAWAYENQQLIAELKLHLSAVTGIQPAIEMALRAYDQAQRDYYSQVAQGERLQVERETFRKRSAALVQGYRTKDLAFRAFRDEALEKYKQLFDLSSRYAYLAANAYDFETGFGLIQALGKLNLPALPIETGELPRPGDTCVFACAGGRKHALRATIAARQEFAESSHPAPACAPSDKPQYCCSAF
jgi:hypothetical protein